ncbi:MULTISPECIES: lysylphosphatidylglycerol synthase transmembrane domain-containing protein [Pseudoxanthomonas]|jgi:Predicted integral membrane protein|uniref:Lysylphosphatidylglycerol synthase-like protein n=1 Tax=Pseudoxanthomonas taiwanensis J19 TaxID=935569 RepID=A0A562DN98_9GAMM|nr:MULTISPECIES: YbhN family protein [Pseudoxanthomonas]TWH10943.1 hypothetical protein L613_002200000440 [Pseudoxanthomonas taiwanensis J19]
MSARRRLLLRLLTLAVLGVVAVLLLRLARQTDWAAVAAALRGYGAGTLATALALVAASYALYCGYELLARRQVGHRVGTRRTVGIALVSYAFSLNFGALVGGGGMRLRLYRGAGLAGGPIARVALYAVTTNWIGYCLLAGMVLASARLPLPGGVAPEAAWRILGAAMLLLVAAYLFACARWPGRPLRVRGHGLPLPTLRIAGWQLLLSTLNWALIGALMFVLLPDGVAYPRVLAVVLLAAVAGALLHTPAGLGAWESAFLLALGGELGRPAIIAALLAWRGLYYVLPLAIALVLYATLEARRPPRTAPRAG